MGTSLKWCGEELKRLDVRRAEKRGTTVGTIYTQYVDILHPEIGVDSTPSKSEISYNEALQLILVIHQ